MSCRPAAWLALPLAGIAGGCGWLMRGYPLATVSGPESPEIARSTRVHLIEASEDGELVVHRLSDGSRTVLATGAIRAPTGPDREGRVAYFVDRDGRSHSDSLWIGSIDRPSPYQPFPRRPGERHFLIHEIELSPVGGRMALHVERVTDEDPLTWTHELAVFDLETHDVETLRVAACGRFAWSPDGKRLAFAEASDSPWQDRVNVLDLDSREVTSTWGPVSSLVGLWFEPDGDALLAATCPRVEYPAQSEYSLWRFEPGSAKPAAWGLPGLCVPIHLGTNGVILGYGLPTAGVRQEYWRPPTNAPSPKHAIKLFDAATGASCTVAPRWASWYGLSAGEVDP